VLVTLNALRVRTRETATENSEPMVPETLSASLS
jgi:hypothetical protein